MAKTIRRRTPIWHVTNWLTQDPGLADRIDALGGSFVWRNLCAFCGVDFDDPGKATIDYLSYRIDQLNLRKAEAQEQLAEIDGQRKAAEASYAKYKSDYPKRVAQAKQARPGSPEAAALAQSIELIVRQAQVCKSRVETLITMVDAKKQEISACTLKIQLAEQKIDIARDNIQFAESMEALGEFVDLGEDVFDEIDRVFEAAQTKADTAVSLDAIRQETNASVLSSGGDEYVLAEYGELPTLEAALAKRVEMPLSLPQAEAEPYKF